MTDRSMTLDEFALHVQREIQAFSHLYEKHSKSSPEDWPLKMGLEDWWEQFVMIDSMRETPAPEHPRET